MKKKFLLISLITVCTAMTCDDDHDVFVKFDNAQFDKNRVLWENANIRNYTYVLSYFSSATGPRKDTIEVVNGVVQNPEEIHFYPYTINDIFKKIKDDVNEGYNEKRSEVYGVTMNVTYDNQYHFPKEVNYSVSYKTNVVGGAYYDLSVSNFQVK